MGQNQNQNGRDIRPGKVEILRRLRAQAQTLRELFAGRNDDSAAILLDGMRRDLDRLVAWVPELETAVREARELEDRAERFARLMEDMSPAKRAAIVSKLERLLGKG